MCSYESIPEEAYLDRNLAIQIIAVMANRLGHNVGVKNRNDEWPILYVDLPTGQVSWHIPSKEVATVFPEYQGEWDGHNVEEKRERLKQFLEASE